MAAKEHKETCLGSVTASVVARHARHFIGFFLLLFSTCLIGCISVSDISHDSRYPTDYIVGGVYRFKQPVFAEKSDLTIFGTYSGLTLYPIGKWTQGIPPSIEEFEKKRGEWKSIAGVVQPGTLIEISKIELENNPENGKMMWIRGRLIDVAWAKKVAELAFISHQAPNPHLLGDLPIVDTNILELVKKP